jgi:hypothetical protein
MSVRRLVAGSLAVIGLAALMGSGLLAQTEREPSAATAEAASPAPVASPRGSAQALPSASPRAANGLGAFFPLPAGATAPSAQNYALFVRNAETHPGVIDLIRRDDELFLDLRPANFDKSYIIMPSIAKGIGGEAFAGRVYDPLVVIFKRVGKRVLWISPNTKYVADKDSSEAASLSISVADSVLFSSPIVAEDTAKEHVVISPSIFLSDFEGIGADLGRAISGPSLPGLLVISVRPTFSVDANKSYYVGTKAFPRNDEISVNLTFNGPPRVVPTVPDGRGIPIVVHYSIIAPPQADPSYVPRYADDRIGYFITARKHYGNDDLASPFQRFIERWNLDAGPIVFTLTNEIPPQYRETVKRAILTWNYAFARVGHPNAIEVRDQPGDPSFDPDDARYNSVRWITSDSPTFSAYSPHESDPDTGQIIRAEVVIDGESMRSIRLGYTNRVEPVERERASLYASGPPLQSTLAAKLADDEQPIDVMTCDIADSSTVQASIGMSELLSNPRVTAAERDRYAQQWLFATVLHEVGHTLGLRHNFVGSTQYTYAQLHDPAFTASHGISASVMDYNPANVAAPTERQGTFFATQLGSYDYWAIQYGYTDTHAKTADAETGPLQQIAALSTQPGHAYGTDEDVVAPYALDPRIARFDLSSDPLAFDREQFAIDDDVANRLAHPYGGDRRSYQDLRQTFITVLNNQLTAAILAAHYMGGIYTSRDHRGHGAPPFTSIPRADQRRAFALIDRYVFSSRAFAYSPELLNGVAPIRFGQHWDSGGIHRSDFPVREVIGEIQDSAITEMFSPSALARIGDQELKQRQPGETMSLADLFAWMNGAVFDDLGQTRIAPVHADLQRRFADLEIQIALLPSANLDQLSLPREVQQLARYNLRELRPKLDGAYRAATDVTTRAHLDDLRSRIDGALQAKTNRPV